MPRPRRCSSMQHSGARRHLVVGPMSATAALSAARPSARSWLGTRGPTPPLRPRWPHRRDPRPRVRTGASRIHRQLHLRPVLKGFIIGLALTIMVGQVPKLLGVQKGTGDFFDQLWHIISELGDASGPTGIVGGISLALLLFLGRLAPRIPASLVVVLAGIVVAKTAHLSAHRGRAGRPHPKRAAALRAPECGGGELSAPGRTLIRHRSGGFR